MAVRYSDRVKVETSNAVGNILKLLEQPDIISFAGGLPAEETFPEAEIQEAARLLLEREGKDALQYGISEGYTPLRAKIAARVNKIYKTDLNENNVLITTGSQQALDMAGRVFCNKGDTVIVEKPTYLGAIMAFNLSEVNYAEIEMDDEGMNLTQLEEVLQNNDRVRMIYVIPDFHNPTGKTWSLERRQGFMKLVEKYEIPVIEDNPYGELRYSGEFLPSLQAMDEKGLVLSMGTFSKTFCPGMRLGWVAAKEEFISKFNQLKLSMDLSSAPFVMRLANIWLENYDFDKHVENLRTLYRKRRDAMLGALEEFMPAGVSYTHPEGGLFCWVTLPEHLDSTEVLRKCVENKVAFVPGDAFFTSAGNSHYFRLNYSYVDEETNREGIRRIADVIKQML